MGNHEYCTECGQSDFHRGQTCQEAYPKEYKKHQAMLRAQETRKAERRAEAVCKELKRLGYPAEIGDYGNVLISKWKLVD